MIATGLLWYDDDTHRPLTTKIADAAQRFRERVGIEPTVCQLNPTLAQQATAQREQPKRRSRKLAQEPVVDLAVRLEPSDSLRPNYFFVGVQEGDKLKRVRGWQSPDQIEDEPRARSSRTRRAAAPVAAKPPVSAGVSRATRRETATSMTPTPVADKNAPVAEKFARKAATAKPAAESLPQPVATAAEPAAKPKREPVTAKGAEVATVSAPMTPKGARKSTKGTAAASPVVVSAPEPSALTLPKRAAKDTPKRARKTKNVATPATPATPATRATVPAPVAATASPVAAKATRRAAKAKSTAAAVALPEPKLSAVAPTLEPTVAAPKSARKAKNAATPATPAPVPTPTPAIPAARAVDQSAPRTRRPAATTTRPAVAAVSASPTGAAQTSLWGDLPPAAPSRKRKSA